MEKKRRTVFQITLAKLNGIRGLSESTFASDSLPELTELAKEFILTCIKRNPSELYRQEQDNFRNAIETMSSKPLFPEGTLETDPFPIPQNMSTEEKDWFTIHSILHTFCSRTDRELYLTVIPLGSISNKGFVFGDVEVFDVNT